MTTAVFPRSARPLRRRLASQSGKLAAWLLSPAKPVLANLAAIPFTVAGWGCLAAAAFELNTIAGLAACCPILMILEHQIADEP